MNLKSFIIFLLCFIIIFSYSKVMANEEVKYEIVKKNEIYEIRKYADRLAVQTININQNNNFRKLFNYISGKNESNEKIKMTTPVTQIEKQGNMTMQFYLPSKFNKNNAPTPTRSDVQIIMIKNGFYAAITYSGRTNEKNFKKHKEILEKKLKEDNISIIGPIIKATYNGPFTLPIYRRNEAMFRINWN
tara:strand:- start:1412 stop:1978 length:567 start_codon:yes stop_codon:yes gene_type:complete